MQLIGIVDPYACTLELACFLRTSKTKFKKKEKSEPPPTPSPVEDHQHKVSKGGKLHWHVAEKRICHESLGKQISHYENGEEIGGIGFLVFSFFE